MIRFVLKQLNNPGNSNDGKFYGDQGQGHIRLVAGCFWNDADCYAAMDRMAAAFWKLAEKKGLC